MIVIINIYIYINIVSPGFWGIYPFRRSGRSWTDPTRSAGFVRGVSWCIKYIRVMFRSTWRNEGSIQNQSQKSITKINLNHITLITSDANCWDWKLIRFSEGPWSSTRWFIPVVRSVTLCHFFGWKTRGCHRITDLFPSPVWRCFLSPERSEQQSRGQSCSVVSHIFCVIFQRTSNDDTAWVWLQVVDPIND